MPGGSAILFNSNRSDNQQIYVMDLTDAGKAGTLTRLTENSADDDHAVDRRNMIQ